ncbi:hypothetical protein CEUSTIGMA_g13309.t1 [Chlamydomonas eustigma]|uniref:Uncharacterized protein n=1 Tax=Chlamydomonas eustigma TaxID=1157962 RepID=A0A250XS94_9CHLO|nr:hypothetical protein CEUSTIGMA_g13309.t1 [Chlamydomonas eustigma]|eukprot:GAX85893.1 hypothetical protein CEUSTIGMA_g13309.t1 [Chlamydomonas eustigma]
MLTFFKDPWFSQPKKEWKGVDWRQTAFEKGLLLSAPKKANLLSHQSGVSLSYLRRLFLCAFTDERVDGGSVASFISHHVIPLTKKYQCRLLDLVPEQYTTACPAYVAIYARGSSLHTLTSQLLNALAGETENLSLWIDFVALQQWGYHTRDKTDLISVQDAMSCSLKGVIFVVDPELRSLTRTWCLFEAWMNIHDSQAPRVQLCLPESLDFEHLLQIDTLCSDIDIVGRSSATRPEDKTQIISEIRACSGVQKMQQVTQEALSRSLRLHLRWSDKMQDQALYCLLLLERGEYSSLQHVLSTAPDLEENEERLNQILPLFKSFLNPGSDALSKSSMLEVLEETGFDKLTALDWYQDIVDSQPEGQNSAITLESFSKWWRGNQAKVQVRISVPMTSDALLSNLFKLVTTLEMRGFHDSARAVKRAVHDKMKCLSDSNDCCLRPGTKLAPPVLHGNWQAVSDEVAWSLYCREFRAAANKLYAFLLSNGPNLDVEPKSLPEVPGHLEEHRKMYEVLSIYLSLMSSLLGQQHSSRRLHSALFRRLARDLRNPSVVHALINPSKHMCTSTKASSVPQGTMRHKKSFTRISPAVSGTSMQVLREMITLKYGKAMPMTCNVIREAMSHLSSVVAMSASLPTAKQVLLEGNETREMDAMTTHYLHGREQDWSQLLSSTAIASAGARHKTSLEGLPSSEFAAKIAEQQDGAHFGVEAWEIRAGAEAVTLAEMRVEGGDRGSGVESSATRDMVSGTSSPIPDDRCLQSTESCLAAGVRGGSRVNGRNGSQLRGSMNSTTSRAGSFSQCNHAGSFTQTRRHPAGSSFTAVSQEDGPCSFTLGARPTTTSLCLTLRPLAGGHYSSSNTEVVIQSPSPKEAVCSRVEPVKNASHKEEEDAVAEVASAIFYEGASTFSQARARLHRHSLTPVLQDSVLPDYLLANNSSEWRTSDHVKPSGFGSSCQPGYAEAEIHRTVHEVGSASLRADCGARPTTSQALAGNWRARRQSLNDNSSSALLLPDLMRPSTSHQHTKTPIESLQDSLVMQSTLCHRPHTSLSMLAPSAAGGVVTNNHKHASIMLTDPTAQRTFQPPELTSITGQMRHSAAPHQLPPQQTDNAQQTQPELAQNSRSRSALRPATHMVTTITTATTAHSTPYSFSAAAAPVVSLLHSSVANRLAAESVTAKMALASKQGQHAGGASAVAQALLSLNPRRQAVQPQGLSK